VDSRADLFVIAGLDPAIHYLTADCGTTAREWMPGSSPGMTTGSAGGPLAQGAAGSDMFSKIQHERTADNVVRQIETLVLEGVLRPGERLPPERELAARLDVSRPILRDALKELEGRGLIRTRHGEGTFVAHVIGTVFEEPMIGLVRRHQRAIFDYLELRRDLESQAAAYAAERATEADRQILGQIFAEMLAAHREDDPEEETGLDIEFHMAVIEAAHNIVLLHMMRSCYRLLAEGVFFNRGQLYSNPAWREALLEQHRAVYEAIQARQPEQARAAAAAHVSFVEETLRRLHQSDAREQVAALRLRKYTLENSRRRAS
jgi:GntR family transcriptional regulator, transcriptional repressor for pyruvate dehydrogenase complex